ncbi:MAG: alpha-glucan family phosphorylase [Fidelibacterota bacterium]
MQTENIRIAYFSAEIGFTPNVPTYSGGLGILAGDHIKAAADNHLPLCGVTLLYKEGYLKQKLDPEGNQTEDYPRFQPLPILEPLDLNVHITLRGRRVNILVWVFYLKGISNHIVPIYFLDTDHPENDEEDKKITFRLYSGDREHRLLQEAILGFGGCETLEVLGLNNIESYHMNEGHASFVTLALRKKFNNDIDKVRQHCIFTSHTPVPAGHDKFDTRLAHSVLGKLIPDDLDRSIVNGELNMSMLALNYSRSANGVSKLHGEVSQKMFPSFNISSITNGVHHTTWTALATREVFDKYIPGWRENADLLRNADSIPDSEIWHMHFENKRRLLDYANAHMQVGYERSRLMLGFARRAAGYKRAMLLFKDPERLAKISDGRLEIVFAGKAHPKDQLGKKIIKNVVQEANKLFGRVLITYLENYNMWLGRLITSGVDVWLNTPLRPNEASGTSGMKAAMNGVPNFSILDGWWAEGCKDGVNGWAIGEENGVGDDDADADSLYTILEQKIIPKYYDEREQWISMMRESIISSADFTAQRMVNDYKKFAYRC